MYPCYRRCSMHPGRLCRYSPRSEYTYTDTVFFVTFRQWSLSRRDYCLSLLNQLSWLSELIDNPLRGAAKSITVRFFVVFPAVAWNCKAKFY